MKKVAVFLTLSTVSFVVLSFIVLKVAHTVFEKKQQLSGLTKEAETIPQLKDQLLSKSDRLKLLEKSFIKEEDLVSVAQAIDALASRVGVAAILHFEREEVLQDERGDFVMPVSITIEGKYDDIMGFLDHLKESRYLFTFNDIDGNSPNGIKNESKIIIRGNLYASNN